MNSMSVDELAAALGPWRSGDGTLADRLADRLVALVDTARLPAGTRLPTERAVAAALAVSRSTVTAAYRRARDAGRLASRQGSGTWVPGAGDRLPGGAGHGSRIPGGAGHGSRIPGAGHGPSSPAFERLGRSGDGVIDLSLAETRCDVHTRELLARILPGRGNDGWLQVAGSGYHPQGLPALRELVADHLRGARVGTGPVRADDVLITTGAQQAIALCATALATPGSTVLVEEASYPGALEAFRRAGLRALAVPADDRGPDPQALADLVVRTRPALLYLVPVGNNPTGVVIPAERLDRIAEVLARSGVTVLEDRTAVPLADPARLPAPLSARLPAGGAVTIGSTSKVAWAGLRTGWAAAPAPLLHDLLAARIAADLAGSLVAQSLAAAVLPHLAELALAVRADVAAGQAVLGATLDAELPQWSGAAPQAGAWRWVRLPGDAQALGRAAAAAGVVVSPGPLFSPHGGLGDRLRIAAVAPPEELAEGVHRLRTAWESLAGGTPSGASRRNGRDLLLI